MFAWLVQLPSWFQITFTIIVFITFLYVLASAVLPIIKRGFTFKNGEKLFSFGSNSSKDICSQGEGKCPFRKDLLIFLNESSKLFQEKHTIVFVSQIKDQMNYAEQKTDQIRLKLHSIYLSELRSKGAADIVQSNSFIAYKYILRDIQKEILARLRYFFRENHFDALSESDFKNYINGKFEYLVSELSGMLNDVYYNKELISREDLYKLNMEYLSDIKPFVVEIFQHSRSVSIDYRLKILELDEKMDNLVKRFIK